MSRLTSHATPRLLSTLAAALMMATAMTTVVTLLPSNPVHAETQQAIDPSHGFADLVDRVMPAVVSVTVKFTNVSSDGTDGLDNGDQQAQPDIPEDSPFRDFFKQFPQFRNGVPMQPQRREGMAQGSGFIISSDGYAVTNNHVVQNADEVSVKLKDGSELKADVIGTDPKTDLALIKIKTDKPLATVKFSDAEPRVGDWVMAVGNPFGLGGTVTTGIISARGRDIGAGPYDDFLQIDASINKGNSGGPSFNLDGDVIGINSAIYSPSGGSVGIGFAIPASTARTVIESLKSNGAVTRGWLGVQIQPVTSDIADSLGLKDAKGAIVADVTENSPALKAGLKNGDVILKVDGKEIADARELARDVAQIVPGKDVPVTIVRNGKTVDVSVKIGTMPGEPKMASNSGTSGSSSLGNLGLKLAPAQDGNGVTVVDVAPGSPAEDRGIKAGDTILEVAGQEVHGPADIKDALKAAGKKRVLMLVRSGDTQRFVALQVQG